jgi:hypothetical protein
MDQASPDTDEQQAMLGALASQFMAAIPENPGVENLARRFGAKLFWARRQENASRIRSTVRAIEETLLDDAEGALAMAASPLLLTAFGDAAMRTGFSPASCRQIVRVLQALDEPETLSELAAELLRQLGTLPEQRHTGVRRELAGKNKTFRVKSGDWEGILNAWLWGASYESIFAGLPSSRRSKINPAIDEWLEGLDYATRWDPEFEKFVEVMRDAVESFLSWLCRACNSLGVHAGGWAAGWGWDLAADFLENGVDTRWAVNARRAGAPANRGTIAFIGRGWPSETLTERDRLGLSHLRDEAGRSAILHLFGTGAGRTEPALATSEQEFSRLQIWLWQQAGLDAEDDIAW